MRGLLLLIAFVAVSANEIHKWNSILLKRIARDRIPSPLATRDLALLHVAQFEAYNAIDQSHQSYLDAFLPYGPFAVPHLAVAQAGFDIVISLFPEDTDDLMAELISSVGEDATEISVLQSKALGSAAAAAVFSMRQSDNSDAEYIHVLPSPMVDGQWRPTPPFRESYLLPLWGQVTPWSMLSGNQFRMMAPLPVDQVDYSRELEQVYSLGSKTSSVRTSIQTESAYLWEGKSVSIPAMWFKIAQQLDTSDDLFESARLFAVLSISLADASIACWDTKFAYTSWRPITALTENVDDSFEPLLETPPTPAYVSSHSTYAAAASMVISQFIGESDQKFEVTVNEITHEFNSLHSAFTEAVDAPLYGGIQHKSDGEQGVLLGYNVAAQALTTCRSLYPTEEPIEATLEAGIFLTVNASSSDSNATSSSEPLPEPLTVRSGIVIAILVFVILLFIAAVVGFVLYGVHVTDRSHKKQKNSDDQFESPLNLYVAPFSTIGPRRPEYVEIHQEQGNFWPYFGIVACFVFVLIMIPVGVYLYFHFWA